MRDKMEKEHGKRLKRDGETDHPWYGYYDDSFWHKGREWIIYRACVKHLGERTSGFPSLWLCALFITVCVCVWFTSWIYLGHVSKGTVIGTRTLDHVTCLEGNGSHHVLFRWVFLWRQHLCTWTIRNLLTPGFNWTPIVGDIIHAFSADTSNKHFMHGYES